MRTAFRVFHLSIATVPAFVGCAMTQTPVQDSGATSTLARASCPADLSDLSSISNAKLGLDGEVEASAKAALRAGTRLAKMAGEVEADVLDACTAIATDLGASKQKLSPADGQSKVEAACGAAAEAIRETKASIKGKARVDATPPRCEASLDAMSDCVAECDAELDPGEVELECSGGKLSGKCEGTCQGQCTVKGSADCSGSCSGTCNGTCTGEIEGECNGTCEGACDGEMTGGRCNGTCGGKCDGKMKGECDAQCNGECDAQCRMDAEGECKGTCTGECSVEFKQPKCDGELRAPKANASCEAECNAKTTADVDCEPGNVKLQASVDADTESVEKLAKTLEKNLPTLLRVGTSMKGRLETAASEAEASLTNMKATVEAAGSDAVQVAGCFVASLEAQAQASMSVKVSVEASASVSGAASGKAG